MNNRLLAGRYELIQKTGEGGMAIVYKGKDRLLNRYVAIKILRPEFTKDEKFIENFIRESQAAAGLTHPNIVGVYDVGREGNIYYIVMELVEGKSLSEIIEEKGRLGYKQAVDYAIQIAQALSLAHKNQIVHRDVKPHNVLVTNQGVAKLADFGIAMPVADGTMEEKSDKVMGSVHYFSPEQARGAYVDERSDIYSLGVVIYEMLTGHVPYDGDNPVNIALMHINNPFPSAKEEVPEVPYQLDRIIHKATEKFQSKRYKKVDEMIDDLKSISYIESRFGSKALYGEFDGDEGGDTRVINRPDNQVKRNQNRNTGNETGTKEKFNLIEFLKSDKGSKAVIIGGAAIILIAGLIILGTLLGWFNDKKEIEVPQFIGDTYDEAVSKAEEAGLKIERGDDVYSNDQEEGYVTAQNPEAGTMVVEGKTIVINVSKGKREGVIPTLIGKTQDQAKTELEELGFVLGTVTQVTSPEDAGKIVKQSIEPGTKADQGAVVNIEVSDGKGVEQAIVPNLIGRTPDEAKSILSALKLEVGDVTYEERADVPENTIFWQSIARDSEVNIYTAISYKVSKGTPPPEESVEPETPESGDDTSGGGSGGGESGGGESGGGESGGGESGGGESGESGSGEGTGGETGTGTGN
ncbi:MAG: Stk1 family PASTA domain-containing Ser/Thr kinase [Firmicutes bacterium]|nr:Stk1 family PASTA domain-containing Ser/Thr kinase [Bacillota bacterium]